MEGWISYPVEYFHPLCSHVSMRLYSFRVWGKVPEKMLELPIHHPVMDTRCHLYSCLKPIDDRDGGLFRRYQLEYKGGEVKTKVFLNNFVKAYNPRTPEQQANRQKFRNAVDAWHDLTQEEKDEYKDKVGFRCMTGYNLFCQEYLNNH